MRAPLLLLPLLAACTGRAPEPAGNDAQRQAAQIEKLEQAIKKEAESNTSAIEQALENESAIIFENRGNLLNEAAPADANSAAPGNAAR